MNKLGQFRDRIKHKYEWRTNFNRIFKEWDTKRNGQITVDDVQKIGKKMGFQLNRKEAELLVAFEDGQRKGTMLPFEFLKFVFGDNRSLPPEQIQRGKANGWESTEPSRDRFGSNQSHTDHPSLQSNQKHINNQSQPLTDQIQNDNNNNYHDNNHDNYNNDHTDNYNDYQHIEEFKSEQPTNLRNQEPHIKAAKPQSKCRSPKVNRRPHINLDLPTSVPNSLERTPRDFSQTKQMITRETRKLRLTERDNVVEFLIGQARKRIFNETQKALELNRKRMVNQGLKKRKEILKIGELKNILEGLDGMKGRKRGVNRFLEKMQAEEPDKVDLGKLRGFLAERASKMNLKTKRPNFAQNVQDIGRDSLQKSFSR